MGSKTLILGVDGIPASLFNQLYDDGQLPNFQSVFQDGLRIRQLVSLFPTDSYTCLPILFQRCSVADLNPLAQLYYDRQSQRYRYAWDFLPLHRVQQKRVFRHSLLGSIHRSLNIGIRDARDADVFIPPFYFIFGAFLSFLGPHFDSLVLKAIPRLFQRFDMIAYWSTSCDHIGHVRGRQAMANALLQFDRKLGSLITRLPEDIQILFLSDHGSAPSHSSFNLSKAVQESGYRVSDRLIQERDVVLSESLLNYAFIYANGDLQDLAEKLSGYKEISFCAYKCAKKDAVGVINDRGKALILRNGNLYQYQPITGDPLEYDIEIPCQMTAQEWLTDTIDTRYPYGLIRLWHLFQNPSCGEIAVSFDDGFNPEWSFTLNGRNKIRSPILKFRQNHGGMSRDQILTIMLACGQKIPSQTLDFALLEDGYDIIKRTLVQQN
jgi:hypothetical protein